METAAIIAVVVIVAIIVVILSIALSSYINRLKYEKKFDDWCNEEIAKWQEKIVS